MVAPNRRSRILTPETEELIENFTEISSTIYDKEDATKDFESNFTSWFEEFNLEWKRFEFIKLQSILHLILSYIFQILTTAILIVSFFETCTKFEKSYALLGIGFYLAVVAINFIYDIVIKYFFSEDDYISEVKQYFESVLEMFQIFKKRLNVLRKRCDWDIKLSSFLDIKSDYSSKETDYTSFSSSAFFLRNVCGIGIGIITSLLCQYFEFQVFPVLKFFYTCLLFTIIVAKSIKIHMLRKSKATMKKVTENFLSWFENKCELFKILQRNESSICSDDLFPLKSLHICRTPRLLNVAVGIVSCAVIASLNITRNDFKNAFMFIVYGIYSALFKHTVKIKKADMDEESSEKNRVEKDHQTSPSHNLFQNLYCSRDLSDPAVNNTVKKRYKASHSNALYEDVDSSEKHPNFTGGNTVKERHKTSHLDILEHSKELPNNAIIVSSYKRKNNNKKSIPPENDPHIPFSNEFPNISSNHHTNENDNFFSETNISATAEETKYHNNFEKEIVLNDNSETSIKIADTNNKSLTSDWELKDNSNINIINQNPHLTFVNFPCSPKTHILPQDDLRKSALKIDDSPRTCNKRKKEKKVLILC